MTCEPTCSLSFWAEGTCTSTFDNLTRSYVRKYGRIDNSASLRDYMQSWIRLNYQISGLKTGWREVRNIFTYDKDWSNWGIYNKGGSHLMDAGLLDDVQYIPLVINVTDDGVSVENADFLKTTVNYSQTADTVVLEPITLDIRTNKLSDTIQYDNIYILNRSSKALEKQLC